MTVNMPVTGRFDTACLAAIDTFLAERYIASGKLPNCQLLVAQGGEIAHFSSQGLAREGGKAIDEGSLFRIASMTKPITSIAFMMLVEAGKVAVDTPVHHVLPEFKGVGVYAGGGGGVPFQTRPTAEPMRMVDLLRHTSGLTYGFQNRSNIDAAYREGRIENWHGGLDLDGFVAALGALPIEFSPGEAWNYSVSTDVLGAVVERVSGGSARRLLQDAHLRAAQDGRHLLRGARGQDRPADRLLYVHPGEGACAIRQRRGKRVEPNAEACFGRRRASVDRARLSQVLHDAAERGRAGRRADRRAQDDRADDDEPSARRWRSGGHVEIIVQRGGQCRNRASVSGSRSISTWRAR